MRSRGFLVFACLKGPVIRKRASKGHEEIFSIKNFERMESVLVF